VIGVISSDDLRVYKQEKLKELEALKAKKQEDLDEVEKRYQQEIREKEIEIEVVDRLIERSENNIATQESAEQNGGNLI
jgi:hypothetical protein